MTILALSALFALLLWWGSTGIVLYLDRRPERTHGRSLGGATLLAVLAVALLVATRGLETPIGACIAFACALAVWGWHELAFLIGRITGPRRQACPAGCGGPRHLRHAVEAILHHELALAATLALLVLLSIGAANRVGAETFALLWIMRISAKLNLFLGVRNPGTELLPGPLAYLGSFFGRRAWNPLLPVSLLAIAALAAALAVAALTAPGAFLATARGLLAALALLALLEHLFLVLPWSVGRLWGWDRTPGLPAAVPAVAAPRALESER